jgi:transcription initiation factor TFIIIB Brf1 subunit/transcription initiation factor TFIIB
MFKNAVAVSLRWWGDLGVLQRKTKEQTLVKTIVVLIRNTTWRCGKLEKSIVRHLHKRHESFSSKDLSVGDIMQNLNLTGEKKSEFLDALKRLEKRNIVKLLPLGPQ